MAPVPGKARAASFRALPTECDFGTPLITIFKESDGNEPVYLCESHVAQVARPSKKGADASPPKDGVDASSIEAQVPAANHRPGGKHRRRPAEVAAAKPSASAKPREIPGEIAAAKPDDSAKPSETTKPNGSAAPEPKASRPPAKSVRVMADLPAKPPARDLTYGNSARALVDEAIWNLPAGDYEVYRAALQEGKPALAAAQAAGGQWAIVHRKIGEYTLKIEALLGESSAKIAVAEVIHKPLEQATLEIIADSSMGDAEKDAAMERLGALEEWLNRGLTPEIAPVQAYRIACVIAERANWGMSPDLPEELKSAYRAVYSSAKNAVAAAVPDALNLAERLANLYAAKAEFESASQASPRQPDGVTITT